MMSDMSSLLDSNNDVTDTTQAALAWFDAHRSQFVDDLLRWVRIPSVSDESAAESGAPYGRGVADMFDEAARTASAYGLASRNHEGYAISVFDPAAHDLQRTESADDDPCDSGRDIAMVSHLDVVPAGPGWLSDPFSPYERDGYVVGRGADDNKGMALLNLYLLRYYREAGIAFRHPLRVLYGGAEETGLDDMRQYVRRHGAPYQAIITDCGFPVNVAQKGEITVQFTLPQPAGLVSLTAGASANAVPGEANATIDCDNASIAAQLATAINCTGTSTCVPVSSSTTPSPAVRANANGTQLVITATGRSGHAAFPDGTVNAIHVLAAGLTVAFDNGTMLASVSVNESLTQLFAALSRWTIDAYGTGFDVAYEDAESGRTTLNLGLIATTGNELTLTIDIRHAVTQKSQDIVSRITQAVIAAGGHILDAQVEPPYSVPRNDPRVTMLTDTYNHIMGTHAEPYAMGGGTHARVIPNAINFGPGLPATDELVAAGKVAPAPDFVHGGAHGPNEWVSIDRLRQAFAIYATTIPQLDRMLA